MKPVSLRKKRTASEGFGRGVSDSPPLHFPALNADMLFDLALGYVKGVAQGHVHIFVRLLIVMFAAYHNMFAGNFKVDADMKEITLMLVLMFEFQRNLATDDVVAELLQFRRLLADSRFYGIGVWEAAKRNL